MRSNGNYEDATFKVLYRNGHNYICEPDTSEFSDLENQVCWKTVNVEDAGIR